MNLYLSIINRNAFFSFFIFCTFSLSAGLNDFIYPNSNYSSFSNYGTLGLIQLPNARILEEGSLAFNWSHNEPYLRGSIVAYPFSWFEASYQYTDVNNALYSNVSEFSGKQTYKDKSFDAKFRILNETKILPAIAIGARDLAGTGVFSSEYLVISKFISNFDLTLGIGWGNLSRDRFSNPLAKISERFNNRTALNNDTQGGEFNTSYFFRGPVDIFGGVEVYLPNLKGMRLKLEYDTTNYRKEGFPDGRLSFDKAFKPVRSSTSNLNLGFVYPVSDSFHIKLNYTKGNTLNFGFSFQRSLSKKMPIISKSSSPIKIENAREIKEVNKLEDIYIYRTSLINLQKERVYLQKASKDGNTLKIVYQQDVHNSFVRSTGRILNILDQITPEDIKSYEILNINAGMGMHSVKIPRNSYSNYKDDGISNLAIKDLSIENLIYDHEDQDIFKYNPGSSFPSTFWKVTPALRSQIGGPDGFYFGDLGISFHSETLFKKNINFIYVMSTTVLDNFDDLKLASDSIIPHVRTDIVQYLKQSRKIAIKRAQLNIFNQLSENIYSKISAGILEEMFGGVGFELLYRPFYRNYAVGIEGWNLTQRAYNQRFKFRNYETLSGHINFYYRHGPSDVLFHIKGGRYLAKDSGFTFNFSRRFKSGLQIGAFFSLTDISKAEFGEGSFDKGFYFHLPIDIFMQDYSKGSAGWGLRPLTRDGAQSVVHSHHLWGVTDQASAYNFTRDLDDIYD